MTLTEMARRNMPNTVTFVTQDEKEDDNTEARNDEPAGVGDTRLILSEDEAGTGLHREHHSKTAGLNQRLAAAEGDGWHGLSKRAWNLCCCLRNQTRCFECRAPELL